jgi:hypothetical protein
MGQWGLNPKKGEGKPKNFREKREREGKGNFTNYCFIACIT